MPIKMPFKKRFKVVKNKTNHDLFNKLKLNNVLFKLSTTLSPSYKLKDLDKTNTQSKQCRSTTYSTRMSR